MGLMQFRIGRRHGKLSMPFLAHRNGMRYDGASANDSYLHGYKYGEEERLKVKACDSHNKTGELDV